MYHSQNRDDLSLLKRYGADFSARDLQGNDLLLSSPVKYDVVKMLVEDFGCDVNTKNASGMTPLHLSCESPDVDVVKFLVDHGADPNAENQKGQTPVDIVYDRSEHDEFGWEEEDDAIIDYFSSLQGSSGN